MTMTDYAARAKALNDELVKLDHSTGFADIAMRHDLRARQVATIEAELRAVADEARRVQREQDAVALATYGKHKPGCAARWRAATGSSQLGPCDCGLAAAI